MPEKHTSYRLSENEKNALSDHIEKIERADQDRRKRVCEDFYSYIEGLLNDVASETKGIKR